MFHSSARRSRTGATAALLSEAHGSVHGYLDAIAVGPGMREELRDRLVGQGGG